MAVRIIPRAAALPHDRVDQFALRNRHRDVRSENDESLVCEARAELVVGLVRVLSGSSDVLGLSAQAMLAGDGRQRLGMEWSRGTSRWP
jgi:hypothetical protein